MQKISLVAENGCIRFLRGFEMKISFLASPTELTETVQDSETIL